MERSIGFSRAVKIGNMISVSGTAAIAPDSYGTVCTSTDAGARPSFAAGEFFYPGSMMPAVWPVYMSA